MTKYPLLSKLCCCALLISLTCSCSSDQSSDKSGTKKRAAGSSKKLVRRKPAITVPQDAYTDVEAALKAATTAKQAGDDKTMQRAEIWLRQQGSKIVPLLATTLHNPEAELPRRITACRALAALGTAARGDLLKAISSEQRLIKIAATERISLIRPADEQTVQQLTQLLADQDQQCRRIAIQSLRRIGTRARSAIPQLENIVNQSKDESIRGEALKALKEIDPRHTLSGLRNSKSD